MKKTILFIISDTSNINDEGKQKAFKNLFLAVSKYCNTEALSRKGIIINDKHRVINSNKFLISFKFIRAYAISYYSHIIYFSNESLTIGTLLRFSIINIFKPKKTKLILIILQHKLQSALNTNIIKVVLKYLRVRIFSCSKEFENNFGRKYSKRMLLVGVNSEKYHPVVKEKKIQLRKKWGFKSDDFILLHVGHISKNRNIEELLDLIEHINSIKIVIVASSFNRGHIDTKIMNAINKKNIILINKYINDISEIYKLSNVYIFMVKNESGAIGLPLSVLEAVSCGIPVITRPFGLLPGIFSTHDNILFYNKYKELVKNIQNIKSIENKVGHSPTSKSFDWNNIAKEVIKNI
jgi:glycosyltransferase involved in cell wall biosynthesis